MTRDETRFLLRNALFGIGYAAFNLFFLSQFMPIGREAWLVALALGLAVWLIFFALCERAFQRASGGAINLTAAGG